MSLDSRQSSDGVSWTDLTAFQRECLWAVLELSRDGDTKGLEVKAYLDERYGEEINHGRLYPNLDRLAELGLVEKGQIDERTNSYEISGPGLELLAHDTARMRAILDERPKPGADVPLPGGQA